MKRQNPYDPPNVPEPESRREESSRSSTRVFLSLVVSLFLLLISLLLFAMASSGVYFSLNPHALQSGYQANPAQFGQEDVPEVIIWCVSSLVALAMVILAAKRTWCLLSQGVKDAFRLRPRNNA